MMMRFLLPITFLCWVGLSAAQEIDTRSIEVVPNDIASEDRFGRAVALYRDTLVVGATFEDQGGQNAGAVYVFERDQGGANNWGQVKKLTASNASAGEGFGSTVAISGDTLVAGSAGATYVFERNLGGPDNWGEIKRIDLLWGKLALWADTLVVSGVGGATHILERNRGGASQWGESKTLLDSPISPLAVAIAADTVVLSYEGTYLVDVHERDQGGVDQWGKVKTLMPDINVRGRRFGQSVAILGDTIVVGSPAGSFRAPADHMPPDDIEPGAFYVFERNHTGLNQWGQTKVQEGDPNNEWFGARLAIWKDTIIAGNLFGGEAIAHSRNKLGQNGWGEIKRFNIVSYSHLNSTDSMVVVGDTVVIGASTANFSRLTQSGAVYVFSLRGPELSEETCFPVRSKNGAVSIICL